VSGVLDPPLLAGAFRNVDVHDSVPRAGYRFRIFLPGADGRPVIERAKVGLAAAATAPDEAERHFRAYAWPIGRRAGGPTFCVDETGEIFATSDHIYVGFPGPSGDAALRAVPGETDASDAPLSPGEFLGRDGNVWRQVN
jgi:hypothetical protein